MNTRVPLQVVVVAAVLLLTVAAGWAQGPAQDSPAELVPGSVTSPMALGNAIGYQGQIELDGAPVNGSCDFQFSLWNAASGPTQIGSTQTRTGVAVNDGLFMVDGLDFGATAFNGDPRWLQIAVRCPAGSGSYTTLSPRAAVRSSPYALYAGNSDQLDGVDSSGFLSTGGGTLTGALGLQGAPLYHNWEIGVDGYWSPPDPALGWFYIKDLNDAVQPLRLLIKDDTGNVGIAKNLGVGTDVPAKRLHVVGESQFDGISTFNIGGGSFAVSTPGGWPGLIAYAPNGHRREMSFKNDRMQILVSTTSSPSPNDNGINIYESGTVGVKVLQITGGSDLAEPFEVVGTKAAEPGMVVAIDAEHPGQLRLADQAYDRKVAGCVSGANGIQPGLTMQQEGSEAGGSVPVSLTGRAYCWADARYGAIEPGDLLTTSETPGHAMKVTDTQRSQGAIIGKAMSSLGDGTGLVLVLISLQ